MQKTNSVVKLLPLQQIDQNTAYGTNRINIAQIDSSTLTTVVHDPIFEKAKSIPVNKSKKEHQVYRVTQSYDSYNNFDLLCKHHLKTNFDQFMNGHNVTMIFAQNEYCSQFPEIVQFCYCAHVHRCLVQRLLDHINENIYDRSIVQLDISFDIFDLKQSIVNEVKDGKQTKQYKNEIVFKNIIPKQPMFPKIILENLPLIQKNAVNHPSVLEIGLILNYNSTLELKKTTFQVLLIPKIQPDQKALSYKKPIQVDCMKHNLLQDPITGLGLTKSMGNVKFNEQNDGSFGVSSNGFSQRSQDFKTDQGFTLADRIKANHCKCLYQQRDNYLFTQQLCPDVKHKEVMRRNLDLTIPPYTKQAQYLNNALFMELQTITSRLVSEYPCSIAPMTPLTDRLKQTFSGISFSTFFAFIHEDESPENFKPLLALGQKYAKIYKFQKWNYSKSHEMVLIDKEELESLRQAAAKHGQIEAQYHQLASDAQVLLNRNSTEKLALISRIEAANARAYALEHQLRHMRKKSKISKSMIDDEYCSCTKDFTPYESCHSAELARSMIQTKIQYLPDAKGEDSVMEESM